MSEESVADFIDGLEEAVEGEWGHIVDTEPWDRLRAAVELDAAWAEAEAALPEGWVILSHELTGYRPWGQFSGDALKGAIRDYTDEWWAEAQRRVGPVIEWNRTRTVIGTGPTPAAALRALAARLREGKG